MSETSTQKTESGIASPISQSENIAKNQNTNSDQVLLNNLNESSIIDNLAFQNKNLEHLEQDTSKKINEPSVSIDSTINELNKDTSKTAQNDPKNNQNGVNFHHISDVGTWKHPDRSFWIFMALSIFTGFLGLDHFYLRSNETAIKKIIVNIAGLGFWYFYDIIQILTEAKKIRKEGLSSPLDWIQGIGRGMFVSKKTKEEQEKGPTFSAPKSYLLYTILAIVFGIFGVDKFYLGYRFQGIVKVASVFSIFFTIFGLTWVIYDAVMAIFFTKNIMEKGISTPPPFNFLFGTPIPAKQLFEVQEEKEKEPSSFLDYIPFGSLFKSAKNIVPNVIQDVVSPLVGPSVCAVAKHAETAKQIGSSAFSLANSTLATAPQIISEVTNQLDNMTNPYNLMNMVNQQKYKGSFEVTPSIVQGIAAKTEANRQLSQKGGARDEISGAGPVLAGTLTALVIAGGLKGVYDFLSNK